jgi:hypothetical protein
MSAYEPADLRRPKPNYEMQRVTENPEYHCKTVTILQTKGHKQVTNWLLLLRIKLIFYLIIQQ